VTYDAYRICGPRWDAWECLDLLVVSVSDLRCSRGLRGPSSARGSGLVLHTGQTSVGAEAIHREEEVLQHRTSSEAALTTDKLTLSLSLIRSLVRSFTHLKEPSPARGCGPVLHAVRDKRQGWGPSSAKRGPASTMPAAIQHSSSASSPIDDGSQLVALAVILAPPFAARPRGGVMVVEARC